jgi:hypothetical protein
MKRTGIILTIALALAAAGLAFGVEKTAVAYNPPPCPTCHSAENVIPLVYGYPSQETVDAADRGEIALGG